MGFNPQTPSPSHLYSEELQLKLYQAFIFSIPILFSMILFLLFYLFYLKKRFSSISSTPANVQQNSNPTALVGSPAAMDVEDNFKEKLPVILYDEHSKARETLCCVCLGEFEAKEELHQIPSCKHVFHIECISHWLHSNATCPLCRCSIVTPTINDIPRAIASGNHLSRSDNEVFNQIPRMAHAEQPQQLTIVVSRVENCSTEHFVDPNEGSSGSSGNSNAESVVISIQSRNS